MDDEIQNVVLAYTEGMEAFLKDSSTKMPIEFTLLRHHPELWRPEDSLAFARLFCHFHLYLSPLITKGSGTNVSTTNQYRCF